MGRTIAMITTSVDGYIAGPGDGPDRGLGEGGERLHYWVVGGPWTYANDSPGTTMHADDSKFLEDVNANVAAGVIGRGMYDASLPSWGEANPFGMPIFILTHRLDPSPDPNSGYVFVGDLPTALAQAREAAGPDKDVAISGGADIIRQALAADELDDLAISVAPVILGRGKRLFDGFDRDLDLEIVDVRRTPLATHLWYRIR